MASIQKRPSGQWRARYRDDTGREHSRHFARKVDAQRWLDEVATAITTGAYVDPRAGRTTFAAYFAEWSRRQVWESSTARNMRQMVDSATFADVRLAAIRRSHLEQWVKTMQSADRGEGKPSGLAPGTIRTRVNYARSVFRAAVRDRVIAADPSAGVSLPRARRADAAMTLPDPAQVRALLTAADSGFAPFIALAAFAGLRLGEAAALQVRDVDFLRRTVQVARQVQRAGGGTVEIRHPKYGSERTVYLADELVTILARHVEDRGLVDADGWLFSGAGDNPPHQNTIGHRWRKACREAGVAGLKLHDLRHFYASGLIAQGCDVVTVQRALGHGSATVTLRTYSHLWPTAEDRTRKAASALFAETLAESPADSVRTDSDREAP